MLKPVLRPNSYKLHNIVVYVRTTSALCSIIIYMGCYNVDFWNLVKVHVLCNLPEVHINFLPKETFQQLSLQLSAITIGCHLIYEMIKCDIHPLTWWVAVFFICTACVYIKSWFTNNRSSPPLLLVTWTIHSIIMACFIYL